ncbi:MAG: hypothetical protein WEB63_05330 [Cucumibacter sp.]
MLKRVLAAFVLAALLAGSAVAGPWEEVDAVAALVRGDHAKAVRLWRPAAEEGNAEAQSSLGVTYATGGGVPLDIVLAHMWFNPSAAQSGEGGHSGRA